MVRISHLWIGEAIMTPLLLVLTLTCAEPVAATDTQRDAVLHWNALALDAIRKDRTAPPLAARNLAILHAAIYDTINTIRQSHRPFRVSLVAKEPIDVESAVATCAARVLSELHPRHARRFDREREATLVEIPASRPRTLGIGLGRYVADRILEWRREDGHDRPSAYAVTASQGVWRPTPPNYDDPLLPEYGRQPRFGLSNRSAISLSPPPKIDDREFRLDVAEVRDLGGVNSLLRTADQTLIALFWNDGPGTCTPPGHWNLIAQTVSRNKKLSLHDNARLFALLNITLADAAIVCWESKFRYRLWRPITMIQQSERDWTPLLDTPPFPSYTSGHSTFSGAAATILGQLLGSDEVEFTIESDGIPGSERSYRGFWEAAQEAGRSRIYGGIHYECDNRAGLALGKSIAVEILRTRLLPLDGDATKPFQPVPEDGVSPRRLPRGSDGNTASIRRERP